MKFISLIESSSGIIRIDTQKYPLLPSDCAVVEPGEVHEVINDSHSDLVLTYFGLQTS